MFRSQNGSRLICTNYMMILKHRNLGYKVFKDPRAQPAEF